MMMLCGGPLSTRQHQVEMHGKRSELMRRAEIKGCGLLHPKRGQ